MNFTKVSKELHDKTLEKVTSIIRKRVKVHLIPENSYDHRLLACTSILQPLALSSFVEVCEDAIERDLRNKIRTINHMARSKGRNLITIETAIACEAAKTLLNEMSASDCKGD